MRLSDPTNLIKIKSITSPARIRTGVLGALLGEPDPEPEILNPHNYSDQLWVWPLDDRASPG